MNLLIEQFFLYLKKNIYLLLMYYVEIQHQKEKNKIYDYVEFTSIENLKSDQQLSFE